MLVHEMQSASRAAFLCSLGKQKDLDEKGRKTKAPLALEFLFINKSSPPLPHPVLGLVLGCLWSTAGETSPLLLAHVWERAWILKFST